MDAWKKKYPELLKEGFELGKLIVISAVVAWAVNSFIIVNAEVPSGSMEDTVETGDRLLGLRTAYVFSEPQRYDIIMFYCPVEEDTLYLKRVIGLPGDKVEIKNAQIYINDSAEPLDESFIKEEWVVNNTDMVFYVPQGCYFVMGDNRNVSFDSRSWPGKAYELGMTTSLEDAQSYAFVPRDKIIAKAEVKYWNKLSYLY